MTDSKKNYSRWVSTASGMANVKKAPGLKAANAEAKKSAAKRSSKRGK